MDGLESDPSVVACNLGNHKLSKNIDSKFRIIDDSIDTRKNDTIFDNSSKILANDNDVDILLIKHTDAIKKTMTDAKMEFDNCIIKDLGFSNKDSDKNKSLTARESQIKSLFDDKTSKGEINSIISLESEDLSQSQNKELILKEERFNNKNLSKSITLPTNSLNIPPQATNKTD